MGYVRPCHSISGTSIACKAQDESLPHRQSQSVRVPRPPRIEQSCGLPLVACRASVCLCVLATFYPRTVVFIHAYIYLHQCRSFQFTLLCQKPAHCTYTTYSAATSVRPLGRVCGDTLKPCTSRRRQKYATLCLWLTAFSGCSVYSHVERQAAGLCIRASTTQKPAPVRPQPAWLFQMKFQPSSICERFVAP